FLQALGPAHGQRNGRHVVSQTKSRKRPEGAFSVKVVTRARTCHREINQSEASGADDQNKTPARVGTGAIKVILWAKSLGIASHRGKRAFARFSLL
ncbi:MAG: hypothetical protein ACN6PV_27330, partial [Achromobacter sp.]|uniref:hypothetical protein n=1 Tax=Achromobacter sp. TaxID=134375 RepID=UPI003CFEC783